MESELCFATSNFPEPPDGLVPEIEFDNPNDLNLASKHVKFILLYKENKITAENTPAINKYGDQVKQWINECFALMSDRHEVEIRKMKEHVYSVFAQYYKNHEMK